MPLQQFTLGAEGWPFEVLAALGVFVGLSIVIAIGLTVWLSGDAASLLRVRASRAETGRELGECPELEEPDLEPPAPDFAALASR